MKRNFVAACLAFGIAIWPTTLSAGFFGDIGKAVGGFFRGVGNILGQGLAGLAQPTVDDTANQMQRVGLSLIDQADKVAGRRIDQIGEKIAQAIEQTDEVLQKQLLALDELLSKKLGAVDVISTKQIFNFEQSVIAIVKYASILLLISALLIVVSSFILRRFAVKDVSNIPFRPIAIGSILVVAVSAIGFASTTLFQPPSQSKLSALRSDLLKSYQYAAQLGDLTGATFYASQVNVLDSSQLGSRLLVELADLQRDLLSRPALFKTSRGSLELNSRVARLDRTWDLINEQNLPLGDLAFLNHELPATAAMIAWQTARYETDEMAAACAAVEALLRYSNTGGKPADASPYVWMAYSYVKWTSVRGPSTNQKCFDDRMLTATLQATQNVLNGFDSSKPNPMIAHAIHYNRAATKYYETASKAYTAMIVADTQFRWKANKDFYKAERDKSADQLITAWNVFLAEIQTIPGIKGSNMVLAMNGLPLALVQRAVALKATDPASRPGFDLAGCNNTAGQMASPDPAAKLAAEQNRFGQFLSLFDPGLRLFVCTEQAALDTKVLGYENSMVAAVTKPGVNPLLELGNLLNNKDFASFSASLNGCIITNDAAILGDRSCKSGEVVNATSLADWVGQGKSSVPLDVVQRVSFVR